MIGEKTLAVLAKPTLVDRLILEHLLYESIRLRFECLYYVNYDPQTCLFHSDGTVDEEDVERAFLMAAVYSKQVSLLIGMSNLHTSSNEERSFSMLRFYGKIIGLIAFTFDPSCPAFKSDSIHRGTCCLKHLCSLGWKRLPEAFFLLPEVPGNQRTKEDMILDILKYTIVHGSSSFEEIHQMIDKVLPEHNQCENDFSLDLLHIQAPEETSLKSLMQEMRVKVKHVFFCSLKGILLKRIAIKKPIKLPLKNTILSKCRENC